MVFKGTTKVFNDRCSVLDVQLKREFEDIWSVSISHAAEVLENWNLIGFQVCGNTCLIEFNTFIDFRFIFLTKCSFKLKF